MTAGHVLLRFGVLLGVFGSPLAMLAVGGNPFGPPKAVVLAIAAVSAAVGVSLDDSARNAVLKGVKGSRILWSALALVALFLAGLLVSPSPLQSLVGSFPDYRGVLAVLGTAVLGIAAFVLISSDKEVRRLLRGASLTLLAVSSIGIGERFGLPPATLKLEESVRVISTAGNASNLGVLLVMLLPLAVWVAAADGVRGWRAVGAVATLSGFLVLVWTLSRGAWVGLAAAAGVAVILLMLQRTKVAARTSRRPVRFLPLAVSAVVVVTAATILMPQVLGRAASFLEGESGTMAWRLSVWRSSAEMVMDRPFLGFGVNGFRFAYPAYQEAGQNDGRYGYVPIEAAHNMTADTAVAGGLPGLVALLALGVGVSAVLWREARRGARGGRAVAVAASLVGAGAALQFHYLTLDTSPLLAVLLAFPARWEMAETRVGKKQPKGDRLIRSVGLALTMVFLSAAVGGLGLVVGDRLSSQATALADSQVEWRLVDAMAARARSWAPWEPALAREHGRAATVRLLNSDRPEAARVGLTAYDRAIALSPEDPILVYERANLLAVSGLRSGDRDVLREAQQGFEKAAEMDPKTGMPLAGQARILLVLGDVDSAVGLLERAVELSPLYASAWRDLADAYSLLGKDGQAQVAAQKAASISE